MSALIINGSDIEPYFPTNRKISDKQKSGIYHLTLSIIDAVEKQIPIGFSYNKSSRLVLPHSVFLQKETPDSTSIIQKPTNIYTKMRFYKKGAQRAIGMDASQLLSTQENARNGWKTFHMDKIDDTRLMTPEEIRSVFQLTDDRIDDDVHISNGFNVAPDFIGNWNHWFRRFLAQVPSQYKL